MFKSIDKIVGVILYCLLLTVYPTITEGQDYNWEWEYTSGLPSDMECTPTNLEITPYCLPGNEGCNTNICCLRLVIEEQPLYEPGLHLRNNYYNPAAQMHIYFEQKSYELEFPSTLYIEFEVRFLSNQDGGGVKFSIGPLGGNILRMSGGEIRLEYGGQTYSIDQAYHTYRIEVMTDVTEGNNIEIYRDDFEGTDEPIIIGKTYNHETFGGEKQIVWGNFILGGGFQSIWRSFRHNGYTTMAHIYHVTNTKDAGFGSLRRAINLANGCPGHDDIVFDTSGTIQPMTPLPPLNDSTGGTTILGGTAPDSVRSVIVDGSLIGPNPNDYYGLILASHDNKIQDLIINNFLATSINIGGDYNKVTGCYINIDSTGDTVQALGSGITITGNYNVIGGCTDAERNAIACDSGSSAVYIIGPVKGKHNRIIGNYIGISANGLAHLIEPGNDETHGINLGIIIFSGEHNRIGGLTRDSGNVIGGFLYGSGIFLDLACNDTYILNNFIGVDANGIDSIPNYYGIRSEISSNTYIGTSNGGGNIICGNSRGVRIAGGYNEIAGNRIGINESGGFLGNGSGIFLGNAAGTLVDTNIIAYNRSNGITCMFPIEITRNIIHDNGGLGIDCGGDGITENSDIDDYTDFPVITSANTDSEGILHILGTAIPEARIEFFEADEDGEPSPPPGESEHGEASRYLGFCIADPSGNIDCSLNPGPPGSPIKISATATSNDATSEFCENVTVSSPFSAFAYSPINMMISDPDGLQFGLDADGNLINEIPGAEYYTDPHDSIYIPSMKIGLYTISYVRDIADPDPDPDYTSILKIAGLPRLMIAVDKEVPDYGEEQIFTYIYETGYHYPNGDANRDGNINIADGVFVVNYFYRGGPPPEPFLAGDSNCDLDVDVEDATTIIDHVFKGGQAPCYFEP